MCIVDMALKISHEHRIIKPAGMDLNRIADPDASQIFPLVENCMILVGGTCVDSQTNADKFTRFYRRTNRLTDSSWRLF